MLNIAICDDDILMTGKMEMLVQNIGRRNFVPIEMEVFWSGESLVEAVAKESCFDIIYLDVEIPSSLPISISR